MANVSRISGFRPVRNLGGAAWNGQLTRYFVPAADGTAIFNGDAVKIAGTASAAGVRGVTKAAVGDAIVGHVLGFSVNPLNLNTPQYRPASANIVDGGMYVYVCDDPNTYYEVQVSGTIANTDVGLNANFVDAGGSTTTGLSGESLDGSTKATTATLTYKILDFALEVDNDVTSANAKILVKINNHQLSTGTGTLGIA
jgi:hypothetical protein